MRHRPLEFEVGDHVFLKVMPKIGVVRFGKHGKLSPRFIGPFEILVISITQVRQNRNFDYKIVNFD